MRALNFGGAQTLPEVRRSPAQADAARQFRVWALQNGRESIAALCDRYASQSQSGTTRVLNGPTGERNSYSLLPREHVLCLADNTDDLLIQLAAVLAVGSEAMMADRPSVQALHGTLPKAVQARITLAPDWTLDTTRFDAVLYHGDSDQLLEISQQLSQRNGPIIGVQRMMSGDTDIQLERLLIERALSINTAAAGGNASLMTIG
jgi:RHH-type proline utilization regulon transcriptional repressor/proline dehydrogenase/delta 1-pyrroline-5-carboxylate dehydrogenase